MDTYASWAQRSNVRPFIPSRRLVSGLVKRNQLNSRIRNLYAHPQGAGYELA